ncbi:hypothetical protein [Streptomyces uncialis]|uniref:hypothetical protein n=1 Tax=Streptomyces uncialis TaxID=1048205 RepID=UPI0033D8A2C7
MEWSLPVLLSDRPPLDGRKAAALLNILLRRTPFRDGIEAETGLPLTDTIADELVGAAL